MSATSFSFTTFFRGLFSGSSAPGASDEPRPTSRSAREVPPADTSARADGGSFYCCYGARQKSDTYEPDAAADGASLPAALYMPDLDEGIQMQGGFLQPADSTPEADRHPVWWHARAVRAVPAAPAATTPTVATARSDDPIEDPDALGDRKSVSSEPVSVEVPFATTHSEPVSGGRAAPSAQTLLTAKDLAVQVHGILSSDGSDAFKLESLARLLQGVSHDPQLVECLVLNVLTSSELKDAQKVYFVAYVARHHIDDGVTQPPKPLSRDAVLAITQGLRDHRAQWKDKISFGQAFSHFYDGAQHILGSEDLSSEKAALQKPDFVASLRKQAGDFNRWAIGKLDERLKARHS